MPGYNTCHYCERLIPPESTTCPFCGKANPTVALHYPKCNNPIQKERMRCNSYGLNLKITHPEYEKPACLADYCESCSSLLVATYPDPKCKTEQPTFNDKYIKCDKPLINKGGQVRWNFKPLPVISRITAPKKDSYSRFIVTFAAKGIKLHL
jgi:hypothetical protein